MIGSRFGTKVDYQLTVSNIIPGKIRYPDISVGEDIVHAISELDLDAIQLINNVEQQIFFRLQCYPSSPRRGG
jgi:hypothetical protein